MTTKYYSRLTVDMPVEEHHYLKMGCAKLGTSMRDFVIKATFEKMEAVEDEWLAERAFKALKEIEENKETVISWGKAKQQLS